MALILYDGLVNVPGKSLSAWVSKVRMILNYKRIPHTTVFLPPATFASTLAALDLPMNDLEGKYTVPVIQYTPSPSSSNNNNADDAQVLPLALADSLRIAHHLDVSYPHTPTILPLESAVTHVAFESTLFKRIMPHMATVAGGTLIPQLDPLMVARMRGAVERIAGGSVEEFYADKGRVQAEWDKVKAGFDEIEGWYKKVDVVLGDEGSGERGDGPFIGGGTEPLYADFALGGLLHWSMKALGRESARWEEVSRVWNGGRWGRVYDALEEYLVVHE